MQLMRWTWVIPLTSLLPAAETTTDQVSPSSADTVNRPGDISIKFSYYTQQDHGGIEELDEDASVFEGIILAKKQLTDTGTLNVRLLGDLVSAASIERSQNADFRAQQSGASGNHRLGLGIGWSERGDRFDWRFGVNGAAEYAYSSTGGNAGVTWNLPGHNTAFSADLQVYLDTVKLIRYNGDNEGSKGRDTYTLDLGWDQILTPYDIISLTLSQTEQSGFIATSYNSVFTPSGEASEELPDSRSRSSATLRWRHSIDELSACEIGGRYYRDDWDLNAYTLDLRYSRYFNDRRLLVEPTYRYHLQDEAKYYRKTWSNALPEYRTSDPDLADFTAHMLGMKVGFLNNSLFGWSGDWDVSFYAYDRDNGLTAYWIILGHKMEF
jgi:Protein of unknown function (DUF3570)